MPRNTLNDLEVPSRDKRFAREFLDGAVFMSAIFAAPFFDLTISPLAAYALIGLSIVLAFMSWMIGDDKESDLRRFIFGFSLGLAISVSHAVAKYYSLTLYLSHMFFAVLAVISSYALAPILKTRSNSATGGRK